MVGDSNWICHSNSDNDRYGLAKSRDSWNGKNGEYIQHSCISYLSPPSNIEILALFAAASIAMGKGAEPKDIRYQNDKKNCRRTIRLVYKACRTAMRRSLSADHDNELPRRQRLSTPMPYH